MNENTLIVVCGYNGDAHQIEDLRPAFEHHQRPILILSPEDAPITTFHEHQCLATGKRAYIGQDSLDRQHRHLLAALEQPFEWYLFNDSDSFCISSEIPSYLYMEKDVLWSNEFDDFRELGYHDPLPHIAFQPPYFMHRNVLRELVIHGKQIACSITPFIDWYMVQACYAAKLKHKKFRNCISLSTANEEDLWKTKCAVRTGADMIHSVKTRKIYEELIFARRDFLADLAAENKF